MPLTTPVPWRGDGLTSRAAWHYRFSDADIAEIEAALGGAQAMTKSEVSPSTFPLPNLSTTLRTIGAELADGGGVVKLAGLPLARYPGAQLRTLFLGLSAHLGTPTVQNGARGLLRDIRDRSLDGGRRVDSADALNWHNDRTDIVGLLCVHEAAAGGISRLASATAIHNAMLERCPQPLEILFQDFARYTPGDEVGGTGHCHALPVFRMDGQKLSTHYSHTYIEQAVSLGGAVALSAAQSAALDTLISITDEIAFEMPLQRGEIQFLNNHAILHSRSAFTDGASRDSQRLLLRVWLSTQGQAIWQA